VATATHLNPTFISYRQADVKDEAAALYGQLSRRLGRKHVFIDGAIGAGQFPPAIKEALEAAAALVVLIGPQWSGVRAGSRRRLHMESDWVRREIRSALKRGILILPVLIGRTALPQPRELPSDIRPMLDFVAIRSAGSSLAELAGEIARHVARAGCHLKVRQKSKRSGRDWWEWKVWLDGPRAQLKAVDAVTYHLHEEFDPPTVEIDTPSDKFALEREGYDGFRIKVVVRFKDKRRVTLFHRLVLT
jgi:hypothetical protein